LLTSTSYSQSRPDSLKFSTDTIEIKESRFLKNYKTNTSFHNYTFEEIRSYPGVSEDVIKFFQKSPGVYFGFDLYNDLMIRGGSSNENSILIDGMEIPNVNHYSVPGSSSGAVSMINLNMVREVDFYAGGFPAIYGDKLSGLIDIKFRNGNDKRHDQNINLSLAGFGGFFEGPITKNGSYLFSIRRSYFELFKDEFKDFQLPNYWDMNLKLNYKSSESKSIEILGMGIIDNTKPVYPSSYNTSKARTDNFTFAIKYSSNEKNFLISNSLSYNTTKSDILINNTLVHSPEYYLKLNDKEFNYKFSYSRKISKAADLDLVSGLKLFLFSDTIAMSALVTFTGFYRPWVYEIKDLNTFKLFSGINFKNKFSPKLFLNSGLRIDYFGAIENKFAITPSLGLSYHYNSKLSFNFSGGIYHQSPWIHWIAAHESNHKLKYLKAVHVIMGTEYLFASDTRLMVEGYIKRYYDYPVSIYDPYSIYINYGAIIGVNLLDEAVSEGKGLIHGIDISFQKKLTDFGFYGGANLSFLRSRFRALAGPLQRSDFDFGQQLILNAGYVFKNGLSFGVNTRYTKGRPFTPFDLESAALYYTPVYINDEYNNKRMPDYFRIDLRTEYKFEIWKNEGIVYIEVLNLLNKDNVYLYTWDYGKSAVKTFYHFGRIPVLGFNYKI
jgi:hypothetical protein